MLINNQAKVAVVGTQYPDLILLKFPFCCCCCYAQLYVWFIFSYSNKGLMNCELNVIRLVVMIK